MGYRIDGMENVAHMTDEGKNIYLAEYGLDLCENQFEVCVLCDVMCRADLPEDQGLIDVRGAVDYNRLCSQAEGSKFISHGMASHMYAEYQDDIDAIASARGADDWSMWGSDHTLGDIIAYVVSECWNRTADDLLRRFHARFDNDPDGTESE